MKRTLLKPRVIRQWKQQKVKLLVVAGKRKTGKDVFVEYVMRNFPGFKHYRIAEGPNLIAKILELPADRKVQHALFGVNKLLYPVLGESAYKRRIARMLDREKPRLAIVESIRTREEYEEFVLKRRGVLIGIMAPDPLRYRRALLDMRLGRKEKRDEGRMTFRGFLKKETVPGEREIDWIIKRAHFIIENNHKKKLPLYREIDEIMRRLGFL